MYLGLVGGGLEPVCTPPPECSAHLWWHGLGIVLSYWCGIIRGKKITRDRINLMSWCDTGGQEATVKNKVVFLIKVVCCGKYIICWDIHCLSSSGIDMLE